MVNNDFYKNLEKEIIKRQMKVVSGQWEGFDLAVFLEHAFNEVRKDNNV